MLENTDSPVKKDSPLVILYAVISAQFLMPFMIAGVNSLLPDIENTTRGGVHNLSLLTTFYVLGLVISQLIAGRMGDVWGKRRIFLCGSFVFVVTNIIMGFMDNIYYMQALRFIQGLGCAIFSACGLAILAVSAPVGNRSQYIGLSTTAIYVGIACGPPVAGFIGAYLGWQWLFWGTGIAGMLTWLFMRFAVHEEWYQCKGEPFNWYNTFVYSLGMAGVAFGSSMLKSNMSTGLCIIFVGFIFLFFYVRLELKAKYPLLDVALLVHNKVFALSSLAAFINYSSSFGMVVFFSLYLQVVRGLSVKQAGFYLAVQFIVQAITSPIAGRLMPVYGGSKLSALGVGICGLGFVASAFFTKDSPMIYFFLAQVGLGVGTGLFAAPNTTMILESVDKAHLGQAASVAGNMRTSGALVNTAIISITLGIFLGDAPVTPENIDAFLLSMKVDLILFGILNLIAIGFALAREKAMHT